TGTYEDLNPVGGGAGWTLTYSSAGGITLVGAVSGSVFSGNWKIGSAPSGEYLRVDVTSGSFSSGTVGSDIILTSTRTYTLVAESLDDLTVTATFSIKDGP